MMRAALAILLLLGAPALGHDAPTGWKYPEECCSSHDCKVVDALRVETTASGYLVDKRYWMQFRDVRESPDGKYHACVTTTFWTRMRCFFAPAPRIM